LLRRIPNNLRWKASHVSASLRLSLKKIESYLQSNNKYTALGASFCYPFPPPIYLQDLKRPCMLPRMFRWVGGIYAPAEVLAKSNFPHTALTPRGHAAWIRYQSFLNSNLAVFCVRLILSRQEDPAPCTPTISCPLARRARPKGPDLEVRESLRSSHISRDMVSRVFLLLTRIVGLIRAWEPGESRWYAPTRTHDVDQGAVDVELLEARAGRGVQVLDAHQVPPRRRGLWDGKVEIRHPRPERPVGAVQGTRVRDLEPIPVSAVM